jgi:hypothetical protein
LQERQLDFERVLGRVRCDAPNDKWQIGNFGQRCRVDRRLARREQDACAASAAELLPKSIIWGEFFGHAINSMATADFVF